MTGIIQIYEASSLAVAMEKIIIVYILVEIYTDFLPKKSKHWLKSIKAPPFVHINKSISAVKSLEIS